MSRGRHRQPSPALKYVALVASVLLALGGASVAVLGSDARLSRLAASAAAVAVVIAVLSARSREREHERELALQSEARQRDNALFADELGALRGALERANEQVNAVRARLTAATAEVERISAQRDRAEQAVEELESRTALVVTVPTLAAEGAAAGSAAETAASTPADATSGPRADTLTLASFERAHAALVALAGDTLIGDAVAEAAAVVVAERPSVGPEVIPARPGELWQPEAEAEAEADQPASAPADRPEVVGSEAVEAQVVEADAVESADAGAAETADADESPAAADASAEVRAEAKGWLHDDEDADEFDVPTLALVAQPDIRVKAAPEAEPADTADEEAAASTGESASSGPDEAASQAVDLGPAPGYAPSSVVDLTAHDQTEALHLPTIKRKRRGA